MRGTFYEYRRSPTIKAEIAQQVLFLSARLALFYWEPGDQRPSQQICAGSSNPAMCSTTRWEIETGRNFKVMGREKKSSRSQYN